MKSDMERRIDRLARAYKKEFGGTLEESRRQVLEDIEEDCIESVEAGVSDGLLCVGHQDIGRRLR